MRRRSSAATIASAVLLVGVTARAQPAGQDVATAQALFEDGKRLMQEGKYAEGCPKLVESQRLDPGGGTLVAIALCHEGEGKTATAWADFNVALGQARKDGRADRERLAAEHIKALEPKLTRVRVSVVTKSEGMEVRRDGALVGEAQWGTALPVDPGDHVFEAKAPGKQPWSATVAVQGAGQTIDVRVPPLSDAPTETTPGPVVPSPAPAPSTSSPMTTPTSGADDGSSQRVWGGVAVGVGVVAGVVGTVFGLSASSKWNKVETACPNPRTCTDPGAVQDSKDAGNAADLSTVFFIVGGVGLVAGAVLYFTAPSSITSKTARALLQGTF